jgi:hypothetical protein
VLRQAVCWLAQELMEAEVSQRAGTGYGERSGDRVARRNGYRERTWDTRVGSIELAIPKLRTGSYFPGFLEPRRRSEQALVAVVQEAYVNGVSTRKVDRLVEALGLAGVSKDQVSRLYGGLDEQVTAFRERPLEGAYPYLWLDAKVEKVRAGGRVEHRALVVAYGVDQSGQREVIGVDVGAAIEARNNQDELPAIRSAATAAGLLLALGILAMTIGLIRGETAGDLRTLTATGATGRTRRTLTAATSGALALLGALLGTGGAYLALTAGYDNDLGSLSRVPLPQLTVILAGLPLVAATAGWLLAGRQPPALALHPLE